MLLCISFALSFFIHFVAASTDGRTPRVSWSIPLNELVLQTPDYGTRNGTKWRRLHAKWDVGSLLITCLKFFGWTRHQLQTLWKKKQKSDEFADAVLKKQPDFPSRGEGYFTYMSPPPGRSPGTSIPTSPGSSSSATDKLTGNNNAAREWSTAHNENTQRLGFGIVCVYSGVHWQWHIVPGRPSPLSIWYQPAFSQHRLC